MTEILNNPATLILIIGVIFCVLFILFTFIKRWKLRQNILHSKEIYVKNAEIEELHKKNNALEIKSISHFQEETALQEKYGEASSKIEAHKWLENSKKALHHKKTLEAEEALVIDEEIKKRQKLLDDFSVETLNSPLKIEKIEGTYSIIGCNQDKEQSRYMGFLYLTQISENRIIAEWVIAGEQTQKGIGFYKGDTVAINFSYEGGGENEEKIYKGVVVYKFITNEILSGFWSEKHGDHEFIGLEEGRKLNESELISYKAKWN